MSEYVKQLKELLELVKDNRPLTEYINREIKILENN